LNKLVLVSKWRMWS